MELDIGRTYLWALLVSLEATIWEGSRLQESWLRPTGLVTRNRRAVAVGGTGYVELEWGFGYGSLSEHLTRLVRGAVEFLSSWLCFLSELHNVNNPHNCEKSGLLGTCRAKRTSQT